jgi:predicted DNA binding CopG/RHH family protein
MMQDKKLYTEDELALFQSLENDIDNGTYKPMEASALHKKKKEFKAVADNTLKKMTTKKSYNLRLFENDIESIKAIALQKGLPYQSLISSIIHQVATKQIKV